MEFEPPLPLTGCLSPRPVALKVCIRCPGAPNPICSGAEGHFRSQGEGKVQGQSLSHHKLLVTLIIIRLRQLIVSTLDGAIQLLMTVQFSKRKCSILETKKQLLYEI